MELFLIPLGADRYELYCEPPATVEEGDDPNAPRAGLFARLRRQFSQVLAVAEHDRNRRAAHPGEPAPTGVIARLKARALAWLADAIAEQRLLWHLRHQEHARLHFPADMPETEALKIARARLQQDADRHWRWLLIDSALLIPAGALFFVPGPNVVGYYFAFRVVGHWLSLRGARNGLERVSWTTLPSEPLAEVRAAIDMTPVQRAHSLSDIASRLRLDHLATFIERLVAVRRAHTA